MTAKEHLEAACELYDGWKENGLPGTAADLAFDIMGHARQALAQLNEAEQPRLPVCTDPLPKYLGCVRHKNGYFDFVTAVHSNGFVSVVGLEGMTASYVDRKSYELAHHPEVPNTPELVEAMKGGK